MDWIVYKIESLISNDIYFGSSKNFETRKNEHLNLLKNNRHHNPGLQNIFNQREVNHKEIFEFQIIKKFDKKGEALNYEEFMINKEHEDINIVNRNTGRISTNQLCISIPYYLHERIEKKAQKKNVSVAEMMKNIFIFSQKNFKNILDKKIKKSNKIRKRTKSRTYNLGKEIIDNIKKVSRETGITKNEISKKYIELYLQKN